MVKITDLPPPQVQEMLHPKVYQIIWHMLPPSTAGEESLARIISIAKYVQQSTTEYKQSTTASEFTDSVVVAILSGKVAAVLLYRDYTLPPINFRVSHQHQQCSSIEITKA